MEFILRNLVVIGTCHWITNEQCCDRNQHLLYVFDWETKTWQDEFITPASTGEFAGKEICSTLLFCVYLGYFSLVFYECN